MKFRSFTDLSYKKKVEALTSGICSQFPKPLTLYSMKTGIPYTATKLYSRIASFLDIPKEDLPFSYIIPYGNCQHSLTPIGCVTKVTIERDNQKGTVIAYQKTDAGEIYGDAAVLRALKASKEAGISLRRMIGVPNKTKKSYARRGYAIAKILDYLECSENLREKDLSEKIGASRLGHVLRELDETGLIEYASVNTDYYGESERNYAVYSLIDKEKAEEYLNDKEMLKKDVRLKRKYFTNWSYLQEAIRYLIENNEATCNDITEKTSIPKKTSLLSILSEIWIAKEPEFSPHIKSSAKITDKGLKALDIYFGPVLKICKNKNFQNEDALKEWNSIKDELSENEVKELLEYQKDLYKDEKQSGTKKEAKEKTNGIMQVLKDMKRMRNESLQKEDSNADINIPYEFRVREIFDIVKRDTLLKIENKGTFGSCLKRLEKEGKIRCAEKKGFYYLVK